MLYFHLKRINYTNLWQLSSCDRSRDSTWSGIDKTSIRQFSGEEAAQFSVLLSGLPKENWNMARSLSATEANKEHALVVSRDFISQPRLSKWNIRFVILYIRIEDITWEDSDVKLSILPSPCYDVLFCLFL